MQEKEKKIQIQADGTANTGINPNPNVKTSTSKRCTIELTPGAKDEVDRIRATFNLNMSEVFRFALLLMRIYADTILQKKEVHIVDPKDPSVVRIIEIPLFCSKDQRKGGE